MSRPKYDFYANPPSTKADVREYITTWLEPVTNPTLVELNGVCYKPISGFRRVSCIHTIYQNQMTGDYVWYVAEDSICDYSGWPTTSYSTMDQLFDAIVDEHCSRWNI